MKNYLFITLLCCALAAQSQQKGGIVAALKIFDDATDQTGMVAAVEAMQTVSDANPNDWQAAYWASFFNSQTGRNSKTPMVYYDKATEYFDRAFAANENKTKRQMGDLYALESLIHGLKAGVYWGQGDNQNGTSFNQKANFALNRALKADKKNPRVYLLTGTDLISNGLRTQNNGWIMAGRAMLEKARVLYASEKPESEVAPSWGSGWINFWMNRAKLD